MNAGAHHGKVTAEHLRRNAYLYVRQSTLQQVLENTESTRRQYELRRRAVALGWPEEQIVVIDSDLGRSGAAAQDREGFQRLVGEVGMGHAGMVMGLEVSRLARNSSDWHRLLEICALSGTLILDEDGVYDPAHFNDRLLLGLKGTMSEAELHVLRARMRGGYLAKARRGELKVRLPVGFIYDAAERVQLDPDHQVQQTIRTLLATFRRTGSAGATARALVEQGMRFPCRPNHGPHAGELVWQEVAYPRVLDVLHNPRYAGAYVFGKTRQRKHASGRCTTRALARDEWTVLLRDQHPGYLSWAEFEENQRRLHENNWRTRGTGGTTPPREGPALLQGLVLCGVCGKPMAVRYHQREQRRVPYYHCARGPLQRESEKCQAIPGRGIDEAISQLLVEVMNPMALEVALSVQQELEARFEEADRLRRQQIERARYEAEAARRRYLRVDPDNRLVADALEADWNEKLRALDAAQAEYKRRRDADKTMLDEKQRERIAALATDFPSLWHATSTSDRDKKRMLRLLVEDVTLLKGPESIAVHVRFRGGGTRSVSVPRPLPAWKRWLTPAETVAEIDRLLEQHTEGEVARILNERGFRSGQGCRFRRATVSNIRRRYDLKSRYERLRARGMMSAAELARLVGVSCQTILRWRRDGSVQAHAYNDKNQCLYDPATQVPAAPARWASARAAGATDR
jgi:DNA invertase Pin-like site-specific DNA recombinase/DNA-binding XRE family transcriptional regulator